MFFLFTQNQTIESLYNLCLSLSHAIPKSLAVMGNSLNTFILVFKTQLHMKYIWNDSGKLRWKDSGKLHWNDSGKLRWNDSGKLLLNNSGNLRQNNSGKLHQNNSGNLNLKF